MAYCHGYVEESVVSATKTDAQALLDGNAAVVRRLAENLLKPLNDNLVERPWGGRRMLEYKSLPATAVPEGVGLGEAFELAADDRDAEARAHPSRIRCADGSTISLPQLLELHAEALLGADFVERHGPCLPLLPKTLDVVELLSVQGHPPGNTEVYVIIEADPGATIRLGFNQDIDAPVMQARLKNGRLEQQRLLALCREGADPNALQRLLAPWLADRNAKPHDVEAALAPLLASTGGFADASPILASLHALYWDVLDSMNEIPVAAGQVIHNATPERITAITGLPASAEVHALGSPQRRELVALEIRRPGPTFRAWDNVRFPLREIDVAAALDALNLSRTEPHEFIVEPRAIARRPGVAVSIDTGHFRLEHLTPTAAVAVDVPAEPPHTLHVLAGRVTLRAASGRELGQLARGESALVPIGVGAYSVTAEGGDANIVKVNLRDAF